MDPLFNGLNETQRKAVKTTEGPVMAIAGAGSGKTSVLTRRIAHIILHLGVPKNNILAITFTNKAADEMKMRIAGLLSTSTRGMWISTFHAMCSRILRDHIDRLGYSRNFLIIDDDDVKQMIKIVMKALDIDVKTIPPARVKPHLLAMKSDPSRVENYEEPLKSHLKRIFPEYQRRLKANNLVDFEDLLILTIRLLEREPAVREHYQRQFEYILVDEFQDTNDPQYRLIRLLSDEKENVFIVGDEDQSIYAFRGANIENIKKFQKDYRDVKTILLEQNYRSTNTILKAANQIIRANKDRIEKNLFSTRGEGEKIHFFKGFSHRDEAEYVAETVKRLQRQGVAYDDMAVLYRANNTSRTFEEVFMQRRLPYKVIGSLSFFQRKEIKDIVAYLRLIVNPDDDYSFLRVVNVPKRGIGAKTVEKLAAHAEKNHTSLHGAIKDTDLSLSKNAKKKLMKFRRLVNDFQKRLETTDFNVFLDELVKESGYLAHLENDDMGEVRHENILELKSMIKETEARHEVSDKETLLTYVLEDIALKSQETEEVEADSVSLMTIHAAKGLEFSVVFLVGAEQGLFPLFRSLDDPKELEEERRLMYVAVTRAKDRLYITNAKQRQWYGETLMNHDSVFLRAIDPELLKLEGLNREQAENEARYTMDYNRSRKMRAKRQSVNYGKRDNDLRQGDKVIHKTFGEGLVVSVAAEQCVVAFAKEHGLKTLMKNHPSITKKKGESHE